MIKGATLTEICNDLYHSNQLTLAIADTDLHLIGYSEHFEYCSEKQPYYLKLLYFVPHVKNYDITLYLNLI